MNDWVESARRRLADAVDAPADAYALSPADVEALLELARAAAHDSGDRTQAPLASYLVGLAHGRNPDRPLSALTAALTGEEARRA